MKTNDSFSGISDDSKKYLWRIVLFGLMIHAFLVLNDGIFQDDWSYWMMGVMGDWEGFKKIWVDLGYTHLQYFYYPIYRYMNPFLVSRILISLAIILTACSFFVICRNNLKIPAWESWVIAMLTVSYPIYNIYLQVPMIHYAVPYALLCFGWALYLNWQTERKVLKFAAIYTLWAPSLYTYNSLLSIYFSFVLILWLTLNPRTRSENKYEKRSLLRFCTAHGFLIAFPFIVYLLKRTFGKPGGWFAGYNEIIFLKSSLIEGIGIFFHSFQRNLIGTIEELIRMSGQLLFPSFWIVFIGVLVVLFIANRRYKFLETPASSTSWLNSRNVWVAVIFLSLAIVPYAMVGKYVYPANGFRHVLTLGFPLSLGLVMLVSYLQTKFKKSAPNFSLYCCITIVILSGATCVYKYCHWHERWVVDRATINTLKTIQPVSAGTLLYYKNPFYRKNDKRDIYRYYELSGLLYYGWGDMKWLGIHDLGTPNEKIIDASLVWANSFDDVFRARNGLRNFKPNGCASEFILIPKDQGKKGWLSLKYWLHRFIWKDQMENFLNSILTIEIRPIPYKNCL